MARKEAALIYKSHANLIRKQIKYPKRQLEMLYALIDYQIEGTEPKFETEQQKDFWDEFLPTINKALTRYKNAVENGKKGAEFGSRGGRPRSGETDEEYHQRKAFEQQSQDQPF